MHAAGLLAALADTVRQVGRHARRGMPALCLTCPAEVLPHHPFIVCLTAPYVDAPHEALGSVICPQCADDPDLMAKIPVALRVIWPDARPIRIHPGSGRS
jgi:hypothetical protein